MRSLVPTSLPITQSNSQLLSSPCLLSAFPSLSPKTANPLISFRRNLLWHPKLFTSCSSDPSTSLNYGGWDDPRLGFDSSRSGESNQLLNLLHSLGIDDRKYLIVFLLGFVCAFSLSRVRFSSIIFFPACAISVAVGFAIGFVNNDRRRVDSFSPKYEKIAGLVEKLIELFDGFDEKIVSLKTGIRRGVDSNHITVSDLENFEKVLESMGDSTLMGRTTVRDMINNNKSVVVPENQEIKSPLYTKTSKRRKEAEFDPWQLLAGGVFGANLAAAQKPVKPKDTVRKDRTYIDFNDGIEVDNVRRHNSNSNSRRFLENEEYRFEDDNVRRRHNSNSNDRRFLEKEEYRYEKSRSLYSNNHRTKHMETSSLFQQKRVVIEDGHFQTDDWLRSTSTSSTVSDDMIFNKYLLEANTLVKQAREVLRSNGDEQHLQTVLNNSAKLLSKALDMKPMSLLAVGQLGNTYLLHGELKLKISRELRGELWSRVGEGRGQEVEEDDEMASNLVNVCEECEELLVEAGRKYRLALSIDGEDMRALYNWGLALSFRGQLIADIGPEAAVDADNIFMAAIDKFDAMISRSNVYAPDALYRWGVALQQRSRLQLRNSKEKTKLLQQAKRLYEDALDMDSDNVQAKEALYSCISELDLRLR